MTYRTLLRLRWSAVLAALAALSVTPARPQSVADAAASTSIELTVGEGRLIRLPAVAASAAVARPEVADVQIPSPTAMFVLAKLPGRSTIQAFGAGGRVLASVDVVVVPDLARVRAALGSRGTVTAAGGTLLLDGEVRTPGEANTANALAVAAAGGKADAVVNRLRVTMPTQVNLRVRVAEVSRTLARELGFNFSVFGDVGGFALGLASGREIVDAAGKILRSATGADSFAAVRRSGGLDFNAVVDALEDDGLVTVLAEPNLTARSGETASFLSGGEFPIPVNRDINGIVVEFKKFGVALDFTPTVLDSGRIALKVRPEVSELNPAAGVQINGLRIPGLSVRRAETTVELGSGQSFAIAGLLQANQTNAVHAIPGLSRLPILGALFRSTRFQRSETELVIIVTPYLVEPVSGPAALTLPTDAVHPALSFDSLFRGKIAKPLPAGDAGFILE